jgi:ABC-type transport system involved in multi-copper enzyme maturation permease subunit
MVVKELRQCLRRGSFVYPFLSIQLMAAGTIAWELLAGATAASTRGVGMLNISLLWSSGPFWMISAGICAVMMPLAGVAMMGQELDEENHGLLLLTKLTRWKIVGGKFIALWGLSALTFISLLPYVVVRYLVGGIEWWREAACSLTALGFAAILTAGSIGVSAIRRTLGRVVMFFVFIGSAALGTLIPLGLSASVSGGLGVIYHLNALAAITCFSALGLSLARSKMRLAAHNFETSPSAMIIGLIVLAPLAIGISTAVTGGYGGVIGLVGVTVAAIFIDVTPKAPKWVPVPQANIPRNRPTLGSGPAH